MPSSKLTVGIVGLPNVGKSTLFNALLQKQQALAANYPFATVDPNVGIVSVPDNRLDKLAEIIYKNKNIKPPVVPATIEFVDIAGLVKGASQGEGLGNQFLANIREVDLICHVLRAFEDPDVVITGEMNPFDDLQTVRIELGLKDLETLEKQAKRIKKEGNKIAEQAREKAIALLQSEQMLNQGEWTDDEYAWLKELSLLTLKQEIFVVNVSEAQLASGKNGRFFVDTLNVGRPQGSAPTGKNVGVPLVGTPNDGRPQGHAPTGENVGVPLVGTQNLGRSQGSASTTESQSKIPPEDIIVISAKIEAELSELPDDEKQLYLTELGLATSGIERMAQVAYQRLNLISFLTAGVKECKAWTIVKGSTAPQAAGVIHTDFTKKFIKAKVCTYTDYISLEGWKGASEAGKVRMEGKDYIIKDGDVVEFMIGS